MKTEIDDTRKFSAGEVRLSIFDYIEVFYNRKRLHSKLGYKTPEEVEKEYWSPVEVS